MMPNMDTLESKPTHNPAEPQPVASETPEKGVLVTPSAVKRIRVILAKEGISTEEGGLRLGVKGGGCSGLSYVIAFDAHPRERDRIFTFDGVRVFIDPKSFVFLNGMTLDFEETLMRQGFNFINPNSTRSCGCGTSFSV
ncbi:MAG: iron-sulfur cluster assembly accessory protein [Terracidiphilus sp.]